jgi:hypothetical protein
VVALLAATALSAPRAEAQLVPTLETKLGAPGGDLGGLLAASLAIGGDVAVVGSPNAAVGGAAFTGSAYVFRRSGGAWTFAARLIASTAAIGDELGISVAVSGDTIVAGAWLADPAGGSSGAAYVFVEPPGGWSGTLTETARLLPSDGAGGNRFGHAVAISADTIAVGAHGYGAGSDNTGAVYVFTRPGGGWAGTIAESARLASSDAESLDELGWAVAIDGDVIVASNPVDDYGGDGSGSGYVYVRPPGGWSGVLTESAKLDDADVDAIDFLGYSVGVSGDTVVLGAPFDATVGGSVAAYVFVEPAGGWAGALTHDAKLQGSDGPQNQQEAVSVAIAGDAVLMGVPLHDELGTNSGSVYLFLEPEGGWAGTQHETLELHAPDAEAGDHFGENVAISGSRLLVAAPLDDPTPTTDGSVYVFTLPLDACVTDPDPACGTPAVPAAAAWPRLLLALILLAAGAGRIARPWAHRAGSPATSSSSRRASST